MKKGHEENFEVRGSLHEAKLKEIGELAELRLRPGKLAPYEQMRLHELAQRQVPV